MLFHKEIGFPSWLSLPKGVFSVFYSDHARNAMKDDRNGKIRPETQVNIDPYRIFEVETDHNNNVVKFLYRTRHDSKNDVIYAFCPFTQQAFTVKTVWLNRRNDKHATLDSSKYDLPE